MSICRIECEANKRALKLTTHLLHVVRRFPVPHAVELSPLALGGRDQSQEAHGQEDAAGEALDQGQLQAQAPGDLDVLATVIVRLIFI